MNERLKPLVDFIRSMSAGSKGVALLGALAVAAVLGASAWFANRPDWSFLYSDLDDQEAAAVVQALSVARVEFERGGMRAPYSIQVDSHDRSAALTAIAAAGALSQNRGGIQTEAGAANLFLSSGERQQASRKREWQEAEEMLETLDFVFSARVGTSVPTERVFGPRQPVTASVTLTLRDQQELTRSQAKTVAQLVRFRLGVGPGDLVISDQTGRGLWDGAAEADASLSGEDWLDIKLRYDRLMEEKANEDLASILGPGRARVLVNSEWDTDQRSSVSTKTAPDSAVVLTEETTARKTPQVSTPVVGGAVGTQSNLDPAGFGVSNAGVADQPSGVAGGTDLVSKDDTARRTYIVDRTTEQVVRTAPLLKRLSVALFVDDGVTTDLAALEGAVKAAVSWVEGRDNFEPLQLAFHEHDAPAAEEGEGAGGGGLAGVLIERGVELLAALAFVVLFFKALRGAVKKSAPESGEEDGDVEPEVEIDPMELARAQVQELIDTDPARVGQILSRWAAEDRTAVGSGR